MKYCVFIHTNHKQILVRRPRLRAQAQFGDADAFDVQYIDTRDHPWMAEQEGQIYLRDGVKRLAERRSAVVHPAALPPHRDHGLRRPRARHRPRHLRRGRHLRAPVRTWAITRSCAASGPVRRARSTSAGIERDAARLREAAALERAEGFRQMFASERDYADWICLKLEDPSTIGVLEPEWNDFDHLSSRTKMLHTTRRKTQPWKTGCPSTGARREVPGIPALGWAMGARRKFFGEYAFLGNYKKHPDPNQERLFFGLLRECLDQGIVTGRDPCRDGPEHVRHDAFEVLEKTRPCRHRRTRCSNYPPDARRRGSRSATPLPRAPHPLAGPPVRDRLWYALPTLPLRTTPRGRSPRGHRHRDVSRLNRSGATICAIRGSRSASAIRAASATRTIGRRQSRDPRGMPERRRLRDHGHAVCRHHDAGCVIEPLCVRVALTALAFHR